ncbi:MAG: hypothetical protein K2P57_02565 [Burkholderiales bacterium]|nr:hypothetical protein [Burkholderiales bacterium]
MLKTLLFVVALVLSSDTYASNFPLTQDLRDKQQSSLEIKGTVTTEKSKVDMQRDAEADKAKASIDDAMVKYAAWTAIFTGLLCIIAFIQMFLFVWQLRLMRQSANDASTAANAARDSAKVAIDTFTTLERPWVFLEKHRIVRREGAPIQPSLLNNYWISLLFKNNGRSPARITNLVFKIIETNELPAVPDYSLCESKLICPATLASGREFESNKVGPSPGKDVQYTIFGKLTYKDMAGVEHHTGFAIDISPHLPAASTNQNELYDFHD